jgi:histidine ammonia-lyase
MGRHGREQAMHWDLRPGEVELSQLRALEAGPLELRLDEATRARLRRSTDAVQEILDEDRTAYGINTGFGLLAQTRIAPDRLAELQRNLVLSHSTGVGSYLDDATVRLILALKVASLCRGHSGVSSGLVDALIALLEMDVLPCIPAKGSVGASGDLAPLAHLSAVLLGEGHARVQGREMPAAEALSRAGLSPIVLGPKEGLALINGTQVSTAMALRGLFAIERVFAAAMVSGAMSVDALLGSDVPFDPRIHAVRGQPGQIRVAEAYRRLLEGSEIRASHRDCDRVQDPYSLRCQPQVMGAALDLIANAARTLAIEANAVTDNPLVFPDEGDVLSGGNFHAEPVAMAADVLAIAVSEIASISERRLSLLVDPHMSAGLPAFLVEESGVNSGFMIAQVTAAALVSENKSLAHPASVDSIPTSANQEDHVSMAAFAARRISEMAENARHVVACELLAAAQGIDFRRPLRSSTVLDRVHGQLRERVGRYERDRYFAPDIEAMAQWIGGDTFVTLVAELLPSHGGGTR